MLCCFNRQIYTGFQQSLVGWGGGGGGGSWGRWENSSVETGSHGRLEMGIPRWIFRGGSRFSAPLKGFQCREICCTLDETLLLSLCGTDRWEIIPASPCVREAPACFPYRGTHSEKQTLNSLLAHALMLKSTFSQPENIPNASLTPIVGTLQTDRANETHFRE